MGKPVGDRFYIGNGWRQNSGMGILPNGVAVFLVNHGRDARATLGTAIFASEAPAVKRITETGRRPVLHGDGGKADVMGVKFGTARHLPGASLAVSAVAIQCSGQRGALGGEKRVPLATVRLARSMRAKSVGGR